jgi:hypothetical protein
MSFKEQRVSNASASMRGAIWKKGEGKKLNKVSSRENKEDKLEAACLLRLP